MMKVHQTAKWLVRWGICDANSLIFCSGAKLENWPLRMVNLGIAQRVPCPAATGFTQRYLYVPTRLASEIAMTYGIELPPLTPTQYNRSARHRILAQRVLMKLTSIHLKEGWQYMPETVVTEREMRSLSNTEDLPRLPDAFVGFHSPDGKRVRYAIEIETEPKSQTRLNVMASGISQYMHPSRNSAFDRCYTIIALPNDSALSRYRETMCPGKILEHFEKRQGQLIPSGYFNEVPHGIFFWLISISGTPLIVKHNN